MLGSVGTLTVSGEPVTSTPQTVSLSGSGEINVRYELKKNISIQRTVYVNEEFVTTVKSLGDVAEVNIPETTEIYVKLIG